MPRHYRSRRNPDGPKARRPRGWRSKVQALGWSLDEAKLWPAERVADVVQRGLQGPGTALATPSSTMQEALVAEEPTHAIAALDVTTRQRQAGKLTPTRSAELVDQAREATQEALIEVRRGLDAYSVAGLQEDERRSALRGLRDSMRRLRTASAQQDFRELQFEAVKAGQGLDQDEAPKATKALQEKARLRREEGIHQLGEAARDVFGPVFGTDTKMDRAERRNRLSSGLPSLVTRVGEAIDIDDTDEAGVSWVGGELVIQEPNSVSLRQLRKMRRWKDEHTTKGVGGAYRQFKGSKAPLRFRPPAEVLSAAQVPSTIIVKGPPGGGGRVLVYRKGAETPRGGFLVHGVDGAQDATGSRALELAINAELLFVASKGDKWRQSSRRDPILYVWEVGSPYLQLLREPGDPPVWAQVKSQYGDTLGRLRAVRSGEALPDGYRIIDWTRGHINQNQLKSVLQKQRDAWIDAERQYKTRTKRSRLRDELREELQAEEPAALPEEQPEEVGAVSEIDVATKTEGLFGF